MSIMGGLLPEGCACGPQPLPLLAQSQSEGAQWAKPLRGPLGTWLTPAPRGTVGQRSQAGMGHPVCLPSLHPCLQVSQWQGGWEGGWGTCCPPPKKSFLWLLLVERALDLEPDYLGSSPGAATI